MVAADHHGGDFNGGHVFLGVCVSRGERPQASRHLKKPQLSKTPAVDAACSHDVNEVGHPSRRGTEAGGPRTWKGRVKAGGARRQTESAPGGKGGV